MERLPSWELIPYPFLPRTFSSSDCVVRFGTFLSFYLGLDFLQGNRGVVCLLHADIQVSLVVMSSNFLALDEITMQVPVYVALKPFQALGVDGYVGEDHLFKYAHGHDLLESGGKVVFDLEDVVVPQDEPLLAIQALYDGQIGFPHGHVPKVVDLVAWLYEPIPALYKRFVHMGGISEPLADKIAVIELPD